MNLDLAGAATGSDTVERNTRDELARAVDHHGDNHTGSPDLDIESRTLDLYRSWYARTEGAVAVPADFPTDLAQVLRAADVGADRWEQGWTVDRVAPTGSVIARRGAAVRLCGRTEYLADERAAMLPRIGDAVAVTGSRERADADGWWRTAGTSWKFTIGHADLVRLYMNVAVDDLATLVRRCTTLLADDERPWMLKVASDVEAHARADSAVLFISTELLDDRWREIGAIVGQLVDGPVAAPPMTLIAQPGLAVAVDPGGASSFGLHRCRLIVEALTSPSLGGGDEVDLIVQRWATDGIDIERPWARRTDRRLPWER